MTDLLQWGCIVLLGMGLASAGTVLLGLSNAYKEMSEELLERERARARKEGDK